MNKAIFLDRDGVINEDTEYVHKIEDIVFCDGIVHFCKKARRNDFLLIVVTNQSGIARGYFSEQDVQKLHLWMGEFFERNGVHITDFFYCPYHKKGTIPEYTKDSSCRKPEPGMILKAAEKWNVNIADSFMIGDKPSDRIKHPQLRSLILKSKYSAEDYDFASLGDLARFLFPNA